MSLYLMEFGDNRHFEMFNITNKKLYGEFVRDHEWLTKTTIPRELSLPDKNSTVITINWKN